jgi:8-oxo-dGTP diphosphatase
MLRVVCAVVENAEGELLLCQRPEGKSQAGLWEFPGGKIEPGESERSALQRELLEELGCEFTIGEALEAVVHKYDEFIIKLLPYRCSLISGQYPRALEHQAIEWVALAAFQNYQLAPADLPIVEQLMGGEIA